MVPIPTTQQCCQLSAMDTITEIGKLLGLSPASSTSWPPITGSYFQVEIEFAEQKAGLFSLAEEEAEPDGTDDVTLAWRV